MRIGVHLATTLQLQHLTHTILNLNMQSSLKHLNQSAQKISGNPREFGLGLPEFVRVPGVTARNCWIGEPPASYILVGILYSLLDWRSQRAFRCCSSAVRRAPSVLSQITFLSVSAQELRKNPGMNPLACLPAGVQLEHLEVEVGEDISLAELLHPCHGGTRVRVQDTIGKLQDLEIRHCLSSPQDLGPLKEPCASGACMKQLPLRRLLLEDFLPGDVLTLLGAMSESHVTQTLKDLILHHLHHRRVPTDPDSSNAIVAALGHFKHLSRVSLPPPTTDYSPLVLLPALRELDVSAQSVGNLYDVLPRFPRLEELRAPSMPSLLGTNGHQQGPLLRSVSLKKLSLRRCGLDSLVAALDSACQGALPSLRVVEVDSMSAVLESTESGRETGITLASRLNQLPHVSFTIPYVCGVHGFDAFFEVCLLTSRLWRKTLYMGDINAFHYTATRLHELPRVVPHLKEFSILDCSSEEILGLCDALSNLGGMVLVEVNVLAEIWSPGLATSILSLCMQGVCLLAGSARARGLKIVLNVDFSNEEVSEDEADQIAAELSILDRSWAKTKAALERHGPCKVTLQVSQYN
ncbi:hypothetical protein DUNSADRAFT_18072 [Dunaliella salina]|uniref:Encoded protein n=1 Tax=Dunaliella salina TaxID=3046 RepID=A0ABQ7G0S0_DUNSA|nr:hypothetical protein DUNSADRAFT_18072 [Dunaliella salina]|eukprot:KAF5828194.1 hypothetical protein DUNSADRAFT_18072 [Dunaliella salina]